MKFVVYYYRRGVGDPIPMQHRKEFLDEVSAALAGADAVLDGGSDAPIHIADETGKVLFSGPDVIATSPLQRLPDFPIERRGH